MPIARPEDILSHLDDKEPCSENYVLVKEIKTALEVEGYTLWPMLGVKVWLSSVHPQYPYHYEASHHIKTPLQAGPYRSSNTMATSVEQAIDKAIIDITTYVHNAIGKGHQPDDDWLVKNEAY